MNVQPQSRFAMPTFRIVLLVTGAILASTLAPLGSTSIAVAIPLIADSVHEDPAAVTRLLVGAYLLICIVGQVPGGRLADRWGTTRTLFVGLGTLLFGAVLGFLVHQLVALTIARMAMALGTALAVPATLALLRTRLPVDLLPVALGFFGTVMSAAAALGPWIGGLVTSLYHWSGVFALNIPVALLSAALLLLGIRPIARPVGDPREGNDVRRDPFDLAGLILLAATVLSLQMALDASGRYWWLGMVCCALGYLLYRHERRHPAPLVSMDLFGRSDFLSCCGSTALNNFTMYAVLFQVPVLAMARWHVDAARVGTLMLAMTIGMMGSGLVAGVLIGRLGPRSTLWLGQILSITGLSLLAWTRADAGILSLAPGLALVGVGVGLTMPTVQSVAMAVTPKQRAGVAAGTLNTARYVGGALGIAIMSLMLSGNDPSNPMAHQVMFVIYIAATLLVAGMGIAIPRRLEAMD